MKLSWKSKGCLKSKPGTGGGSYHTTGEARHLENHCNEAGRDFTQQRLIEKNKKELKIKKRLQQRQKNVKRRLLPN